VTDPGWIPADLERRIDDPEALHRLALLSAIGLGTPHDPPRALERLGRAAALGHALAADSLAVLEAGPGGLEDWFRPPAPRVASERPHVLLADSFVSPAVCDWIRARAEPHMARAEVYDPVSGAGRPDPVRTNTAFVFDLASSDLVLVLVRERMARLAGLPVPGLEPCQVLRYTPGQKFDWHVDFLDPAIPGHRDDLARAGQRIATGLIWLNDDYEGGETAFEAGDLRFRGRKGDAILWANVTPNGAPDPLTRHAGLPPISGEKWILSQWMRPRAPVRR
jgi:prolyl 4-hydroxylase